MIAGIIVGIIVGILVAVVVMKRVSPNEDQAGGNNPKYAAGTGTITSAQSGFVVNKSANIINGASNAMYDQVGPNGGAVPSAADYAVAGDASQPEYLSPVSSKGGQQTAGEGLYGDIADTGMNMYDYADGQLQQQPAYDTATMKAGGDLYGEVPVYDTGAAGADPTYDMGNAGAGAGNGQPVLYDTAAGSLGSPDYQLAKDGSLRLKSTRRSNPIAAANALRRYQEAQGATGPHRLPQEQHHRLNFFSGNLIGTCNWNAMSSR